MTSCQTLAEHCKDIAGASTALSLDGKYWEARTFASQYAEPIDIGAGSRFYFSDGSCATFCAPFGVSVVSTELLACLS